MDLSKLAGMDVVIDGLVKDLTEDERDLFDAGFYFGQMKILADIVPLLEKSDIKVDLSLIVMEKSVEAIKFFKEYK